MTLLDHYLKAVRMYLPGGAQQDDIISELSEHLLSTIEEREAELGRRLTEVEQVALFGEYGNPISVAERYGSTRRGVAFGRQIISLELFPLYARILALNWSLTIAALIVIPLYQGRSVTWTLQNFLWPLFTQFVLVTVIFAFVDRFQTLSRRRAASASPNWRFPPAYLQPIPRWQSVAGACALGLAAGLWALTPFALPWIAGPNVPLAYTTEGSFFFWPVLVLLLVGVAQRIATFIHPEWNVLQAVTRLITNGSAVLLLYAFVLSYPYVRVVLSYPTVRASGVVPDTVAADLLARRINGGIWWMTLAGVSLYWVINAGFHLWLCAQLARYARRRRAEPVGTLGSSKPYQIHGVVMSILRRSLIALPLAAVVIAAGFTRVAATQATPPAAASQAAQSAPGAATGEAVYRDTCASCHEAGVPRAVNRTALSRMSADNIRFALTQGTMRQQASALTPVQIDSVVRFLAAPEATTTGVVNRCEQQRPPGNAMSRPRWNGWGVDTAQTRFQPAAMAQLTADQVTKLKLKWAFAFPGVTQAFAQPTIVGDRLFVGGANRKVYSLNATTGCEYWTFDTEGPVRAAITIAVNGDSWIAYIADQRSNVYALDALTGSPLWKRKVELFLGAVITGAPTLAGETLYVGTSSSEEASAVTPTYQCCRFRGSVTALNAVTGEVRWKTYTIPDEPVQTRKNAQGTQMWGPSGAPIWSSPTVDLQAKRVYVTTGDSYSDPAARTSDAFLAFDSETGKMLWSRQMTANDAYTMGCGLPAPLNGNCPEANGPDHDFGSSPILITLPNGRKQLVAGQKSGVVHAVDPETGAIMWQRRLGTGGMLGGVQWGSAYDGTRVYAALSDVALGPAPPDGRGAQPTMLGIPMLLDAKAGGGLWALDPRTGEIIWRTPHPGCADKPGCSPAQSGAVTAIPGVVFSGGLDGHLRAYDAAKGAIIWDVDTMREYTTVNGVKGAGGSLDGPGVVVVGGMLYVNSGYAFIGGTPGNVLLAFSVDGK